MPPFPPAHFPCRLLPCRPPGPGRARERRRPSSPGFAFLLPTLREIAKYITGETLLEIRERADWRRVFEALGLERARGGNEYDWWARSPFSEDRRPSFHIGERGWYCFSTDQGGGVIELVQKVMGKALGYEMNCYEAGRWLIENGLSSVRDAGAADAEGGGGRTRAGKGVGERDTRYAPEAEPAAEKSANRPIRQDLLPLLSAEHPELVRRGISPATCAYLGCGYLPEGGRSPLSGRIVFQVRGVRDGKPVILSHIGRALSEDQEESGGKWHHYKGFAKTQELYNIDRLLLDPEAITQAQASGHILLTEGCFDVAQLVEAGIRNAAATFGAHLGPDQLPRLKEIAAATGAGRFRVFYDRDAAGTSGQAAVVALINRTGELTATGFDWDVTFPSPSRGPVVIPDTIADPGDFSPEQLQFLRQQGTL